MLFELFRCRETDAVDTLQYMILGITLPVYTGMFYQLEVTAELYVIYMRSTAEICEIALVVAADLTVFEMADQIQLIRIVLELL